MVYPIVSVIQVIPERKALPSKLTFVNSVFNYEEVHVHIV